MSQRTIKAEKVSGAMSNCVRVFAKSGGRTTRWMVCAIGGIGQPAALSISRRGRVGGVNAGRSAGGMTLCSAQGERSKCIRATSAIAFPGGAASLKRKGIQVFNGKRK